LPESVEERQKALELIRHVLSASGELSDEADERLNRVAALFETGVPVLPSPASAPVNSVEAIKPSRPRPKSPQVGAKP
jgi:hypothetical protein